MKHSSFFFFKNSLGAKMRKGIRNFCNGDGSTSTLNQHHLSPDNIDMATAVHVSSPFNSGKHPTLEEMIMQLELEEEIVRKSKLDQDLLAMKGRRMSCVNNSDILRSARNALNQYPRFSLDGRDAMYRSSFRNFDQVPARKSVCCDGGVLMRERMLIGRNDNYLERKKPPCLPASLGGESVVWCKPGVIAKLMGLDAIPVPVVVNSRAGKETLSSIVKRQNLRRRVERHEMERRLSSDHDININNRRRMRMAASSSSSSKNHGGGYCVTKPITVEPQIDYEGGWPTRSFHPRNQL